MGKDIKRRFTVSLDIDTKDAEKQIKATVGNLKTILSEMGTASDKMTYFKDLAGYLSQIDAAMDAFKKKHGQGLFDKTFGGLDSNLRKELENVFGVAKEQLTTLDQLKSKVAAAKHSGTTTGADLKPLEQEVRSLYEAAGMLDKLNLSGKGKVETRIKKLEAALEGFAVVFNGVNNKISQGFGFGGKGFEDLGDGIVKDIKSSTQDIEKSFEDLKKLIKKKVSEVFDAQVNGADLKKLDSIKKSLYDALSLSPNDDAFYSIEDIFDELSDSGDEKKAIDAITSIAKRIKNAKQELNGALNGEDKQPLSSSSGQINVGDKIRKEADKTVDAIEYGKKQIVNAWKEYYRAAMNAEQQGKKIEGGQEVSYEMDKAKADIEKMLDKWNIGGKAKFDILSLDEYIVDKDIGFDDIEKEINKMFGQYNIKPDISMEELAGEVTDVTNDMSKLGDSAQQSSSEIASGMENAKRQTLAVGDAFEQLVKYISQSGLSPSNFFKLLSHGAEEATEELKNILTTLNLINADGSVNFSTLQSGFSNVGGMISDDHVLIARDESKLPFSLETKQKSLDAKAMGANIGAVLEVYEDKINGIIYELQNKVEGQAILDFEKGIINTDFLDATDEQIKQFIKDLEILKSTGLYVDWNGSNVLYDKDKGFSFIDFFASSVEPYTVSAENSVQENLQAFFDKIFHNFNLNTSESLDVMAFKTHLENLMPDVTKQTAAQEDMVEASREVKIATDATSSSIAKEETSHEQNTAAINEENKALQAQIELKKKAQSMTWKEFALDESLTDMKGASGLQTLSDTEKFWKQANYDKKIWFYELSEAETNDVINKNLDYDLRYDWYSAQEDFSKKTEIENAILANDELRNAALNKLYQLYKQYIDSAMQFDEFLNSELTVYRGDDYPKLFGDEQQLSFSFKESTAEHFGHVEQTKIIPKNTLGSVTIPSMEGETEVWIPSSNLPYVGNTSQSFDEYYTSLTDEKKKNLDAMLIQLEAQRVKSLLDDNLLHLMDKASWSQSFNDDVLNKFKSGIIPDIIDEFSGDFDADNFAFAYNELPDIQKKLVAYYASLKEQIDGMGKVWGSDLNELAKTDLVNSIVNDKEGVKKHVAGLTGEAKFKLFGDATQDIGAEVGVHQKNTQAISAEQQAQDALNNSKQAYAEVQQKIAAATLAADGGKDSELNSIWNSLSQVYQTEQKQLSGEIYSDILGDGYYQHPTEGYLISYEDIIAEVENFEKTYGDNLNYVKDYLSQVFARYEAQVIDDVVDIEVLDANSLDYNEVDKKVFDKAWELLEEGKSKQSDELTSILGSLSGINNDSMLNPDLIDNGQFEHMGTGEIINVTDFLETIGEYETKYGENLQYVKDYVNQVFEKYNSQIDAFLSGQDMSFFDDQSSDFEDELILDGFELDDSDIYGKSSAQDYSDSIDDAQRQLQVEQEITAEKQQQVLLDNQEDQSSLGVANVDNESLALNNLLIAIGDVEQAVRNKTQAFIDEGATVDQVVQQELLALSKLAVALDEIKLTIGSLGNISITDNLDDADLQNINIPVVDGDIADGSQALNGPYALENTLLATNVILGNILTAINTGEQNSSLSDALNNAVTELKNVANGIVTHQKAQQTDKSAASAKIANNYNQLSDISANAVSSLGDEVQIKQMNALADGVVRVEGAVRDADGVWKGFTVDIDESNNAVIRAVNEQSKFATTLNEAAKAAKKAGAANDFTKSLSSQQSAFNQYRKDLQDVDYLNDEVRDDLDQLALRLQSISDADGLEAWKSDFSALRDEISTAKTVFEKLELDKISKLRGQVNSEFKNLDFMTTTSDPTDEQREILELRKQILSQLEEYKLGIAEGKEVELSSINATMAALREKINAYREANDLASGGKQKYGATAVLNATAKYNSLSQQASSGEFANSKTVQAALQQYEAAYNNLIQKRKELAQVEGSLTDTQKAEFKELQAECNKYGKILDKIITDSQKLNAQAANNQPYMLDDDFEDSDAGRKAALTDFVQEMYGVSVAAEDFKNNWNEVVFAVDNGDGTFTQMSATFNAARTQIVALAGDTKKVTGAFESFFNELKGKFKSVGAYLISSISIHEVWQQVRKGVEYVKEIDSALTELKKVTDETDASYSRFLQDMSKTAGVVGSTVSELTTMAAEWARLGYSMEESAKLAESTAILLNVSEFEDATKASEALISTMQAFSYTADESQHVVDILNEVGNNFAVSSDGIATALQDSASALMEGGNNLEQAVALVAAANRVVRFVPHYYSNIVI